ncbi:polyprenyl synthetase family protein [Nocardia donostiensis]|uniref:Polyprenyl synthetase n=1 Tax=Nocardia donostiensis TaxID=1538463 RepID=A0A1V2TA00_9NOCA|nr:polyprenyl synthetase family protein [Nocardia donostiensis]ONM46278.1 polyprenyl synthetase [Nocardia donostiensis]OQS12461.1 polyprenyl synthetase [Nocardia donostiensis]OQS18452.1 polyprenyl synthetase [Nocardia donostiensis]
MPSENISAVFPYLEADLDRVRLILGPIRFEGRPELTALTDEGPDTSRRLVRPTLTLLSYYLLTDPTVPAEDRAVCAAAAVELLHLGSLYHDDVIDHAYQRRGHPNANAVWGSHMAVLGGDSVTIAGMHLLAELGQREILAGTLASKQMCAGMVIEAADLYDASRSEQSYLDAIDGKTAAILSLACRVGAMQSGRPDDQQEALAQFGRYFGLAYQLRDDILDLTSTVDEMGKPVNADLPEGIYTLPVIRAAARDRDLGRLLRKGMTGEEAARARELVIASGAVDEAQASADEFMDQAAAQLAAVPVDPRACHALSGYARSALDRRTPGPAASWQPTQPRGAHDDAVSPEVERWLKNWMVDTGLAASPAELDYHRWLGAVQIPAAALAPAADTAREQTAYGMGVLVLVWDDLFEDPQLRDPQAVTALRRGLVAMVRQDPETLRGKGAVPKAWGSLWPRLREGRSAHWQERFLDGLEEWFAAAEREAHYRIDGYIPPTADYLPLRMSTSGAEVALACMEVYQDRELPPKLRSHPVIRRLEELAFLVTFVENDVAGLDRDEIEHVPYNLVRAIRHETGCTREEAIEQVQRQTAEYRAQLESVARYIPALLHALPGLSGQGKEYASIYRNMTNVALWGRESSRYTPSAYAEPDLERLRREIYDPAYAAP